MYRTGMRPVVAVSPVVSVAVAHTLAENSVRIGIRSVHAFRSTSLVMSIAIPQEVGPHCKKAARSGTDTARYGKTEFP